MEKVNLEQLIYFSRRCGERIDYVQAGGGNTSIKTDDGKMYIKASGKRLSDLKSQADFALIDNDNLLADFNDINWSKLSKHKRELQAKEIVERNNLTKGVKASIETLLHAVIPGSVIHLHPISITKLFSLNENPVNFEVSNEIVIPYATPGIDLALLLYSEINKNKHGRDKQIIALLRNHGLIVGDATPELAYQQVKNFISRANNFISLESKSYDLANKISEILEQTHKLPIVTYFSETSRLPKVISPFFPDAVVFLGPQPLIIESVDELADQVDNFIKKLHVPPRCFVFQENIFFSAATMAKAREAEEVWYLQTKASDHKTQSLSNDEVTYLLNWEAEKFRQNI